MPEPTRSQLPRGVWIASWDGPNGETVLLAIDSAHRLLGLPMAVPMGWSVERASDALWLVLDTLDPENDALARAAPKAGRASHLQLVEG
jgi:hypothetical protein